MYLSDELKKEKLVTRVLRSKPEWCNNIIKHWNDCYINSSIGESHLKLSDFVIQSNYRRGNINMNNVVGQWDHYAGQT